MVFVEVYTGNSLIKILLTYGGFDEFDGFLGVTMT
jgi:hypothetical protein